MLECVLRLLLHIVLTDLGGYFDCVHIIARASMLCFAFTKAYIYMGGIAFDTFFRFSFSVILILCAICLWYLLFLLIWRDEVFHT
jgi:hypothetical protein